MLWYTDRSRYEAGLDRCPRARYLGYHAGPAGSGLAPKRHSMPLIAGIAIHSTLAEVLRVMQQTDALPSEDAVRQAIQPQVEEYRRQVEAHGVEQWEEVDDAYVEQMINEQCALLSGLVWCWVLEVLPETHRRWRIVSVEEEEQLILGCTCGLGEVGSFEEHEQRSCDGIGVMGRGDFVGEDRSSSGHYSWHDFKTTSYVGERWESQWETKLQFALAMLGGERRLGCEIHEVYVHGLIKGGRWRERRQDGTRGSKYQSSPLCYGWKRSGQPPLEPDDWKPTYEYWDEAEQRMRRCGKGYRRTPVWEYAPDYSHRESAERWVRQLPQRVRQQQVILIGPMNRQRVMMQSLARQVAAEERRWQQVLMELQEAADLRGASYWTDAEWMQVLDDLVPQSWSCRRYGKEHRCAFERICFREAGWENPFEAGYILRTPHHAQEQRIWDEDE